MEWSEEEEYVQGKLWIKADQETHKMDGIYELEVVWTEKEETEKPEIKPDLMESYNKIRRTCQLWKLSGIWLLVFQRAGDSKDTGYRSAQWNRAGRSGGS